MKAIQVVQAHTVTDLINVLITFDQELTAKIEAAVKTKFVLIDSLGAYFAHYRGRRMQRLRKSLLVELACKVRKLAVGKYGKGRHFENEQLLKFTFSYQLSLAKFSVCLVSEGHKSSTLTEKMLRILLIC